MLQHRIRVIGLFLTGVILLVPSLGRGQSISSYKKGVIKLEADPQFGQNEDWNVFIRDKRQDLVVLPDGRIYVASSLDHCVRIFDRHGRFIKKFGQKGQGPGDLTNPGSLSVLDDHILVIGEYATQLRISLFQLDGTFLKVLKTRSPCYRPVALSKGKIAYMAMHYGPEKNTSQMIKKEIILLDINTGEEVVVDQFEQIFKYRTTSRGAAVSDDAFPGKVFFAQTKSGHLVTGSTDRFFLNVFSPSGNKIRTIDLKTDGLKVDKNYIERYREERIRSYDDRKDKPYYQGVVKAFQKSHFCLTPGQDFPSMKHLLVDSQGHILVFKFTDCVGPCREVFQVYAEDGRFLCETVLDEGIYELDIDPHFNNFVFTDAGIIGVLSRKNPEDMLLRLVKIPVLH